MFTECLAMLEQQDKKKDEANSPNCKKEETVPPTLSPGVWGNSLSLEQQHYIKAAALLYPPPHSQESFEDNHWVQHYTIKDHLTQSIIINHSSSTIDSTAYTQRSFDTGHTFKSHSTSSCHHTTTKHTPSHHPPTTQPPATHPPPATINNCR